METKILVSGSTGLVGEALCAALAGEGMGVRRLVRGAVEPGSGDVRWDVEAGVLEAEACSGFRAVVHLAGEPIAARRWSEEQKRRIRDSRVKGTALLASRLAEAAERPEVLVCASAVGIYGSRGEEVLTEDSEGGEGFLAEVVREWEAAAEPARAAGIRVVHARLGIVLSPEGGALAKMLPVFRLGLGGRLGDGQAWMSWIGLPDVVGGLRYLMDRRELAGAFNFTAPVPVRNVEFTRELGAVLRRPAVLPVPGGALRLLLGEMGETLLLNSARVLPKRLEESGYAFEMPRLAPALGVLL